MTTSINYRIMLNMLFAFSSSPVFSVYKTLYVYKHELKLSSLSEPAPLRG